MQVIMYDQDFKQDVGVVDRRRVGISRGSHQGNGISPARGARTTLRESDVP